MLNFLLDTTRPDWITTSFPIIRSIIIILIALFAILMIVLVFMQIGTGSDTSNVITGNKESYYSQNKSGNKEGRITRWVYICFATISVLILLYFLSFLIYKG